MEIDIGDRAIDMDFYTEFHGSLQHGSVEVRSVHMPIRMSVFLYPMGHQVDFVQDSAVTISSEGKSDGIDTVGLELISDSPPPQ